MGADDSTEERAAKATRNVTAVRYHDESTGSNEAPRPMPRERSLLGLLERVMQTEAVHQVFGVMLGVTVFTLAETKLAPEDTWQAVLAGAGTTALWTSRLTDPMGEQDDT